MSDVQTENLAAALKYRKALSKLFAKQTEAQDKLVDKFKKKQADLLAALNPEVATLVGVTPVTP